MRKQITMKRNTALLVWALLLTLIVVLVRTTDPTNSTEESTTVSVTEQETTQIDISTTVPETTEAQTDVEVVTVQKKVKDNLIYPEDEVELIALVTVAEAEGESEYGKRLVIDTILNRVDSKSFPNTIHGVVYQKNQFTSMWNGRTSRCVVTDDVRQLVREEMESRTNNEVLFFTAGGYGKYGTPLFQEGNHYFCK